MLRDLRRDDSGAIAVLFAIIFLVLGRHLGPCCRRRLLVHVQAPATIRSRCGSARRLHGACATLVECRRLGQRPTTTRAATSRRHSTAPLRVFRDTEIGSNYVKVTVASDAPVFLSQYLLGRGTTLIRAQSVAKIGYLAGGRSPVPWGLSIINIGEMSAGLGGQNTSLSEDGSGDVVGHLRCGPVGFADSARDQRTGLHRGLRRPRARCAIADNGSCGRRGRQQDDVHFGRRFFRTRLGHAGLAAGNRRQGRDDASAEARSASRR